MQVTGRSASELIVSMFAPLAAIRLATEAMRGRWQRAAEHGHVQPPGGG